MQGRYHAPALSKELPAGSGPLRPRSSAPVQRHVGSQDEPWIALVRRRFPVHQRLAGPIQEVVAASRQFNEGQYVITGNTRNAPATLGGHEAERNLSSRTASRMSRHDAPVIGLWR